ncbi:MAG: methionyl-tRNA formyltransferase [Eubacteriales bacterium]
MDKICSRKEKIVFMGTSGFAEVALRALCKAGYDVGMVITKADVQKNRGKKLLACEVKKTASELGLTVLQPEKLTGNDEVYDELLKYAPDVIVVAQYGKILPKEIIDLPRYGCINIHASLLPKFRGAAPIQRAIMSGDEITGVTLMKMDLGLDTGDIIAKNSVPIGKKNANELFEELAKVGADLLLKMLPSIFEGTASFEKQDEACATYAQMIEKSEGKLDFSKSAKVLERQIRAIPSYTYCDGELLKIWQSEAYEDLENDKKANVPNGGITEISKKILKVKCGQGELSFTEVQMPGKKRISVADFLNGNQLRADTVFG